jgi:uncharacterized protein (TIGR02266 family)
MDSSHLEPGRQRGNEAESLDSETLRRQEEDLSARERAADTALSEARCDLESFGRRERTLHDAVLQHLQGATVIPALEALVHRCEAFTAPHLRPCASSEEVQRARLAAIASRERALATANDEVKRFSEALAVAQKRLKDDEALFSKLAAAPPGQRGLARVRFEAEVTLESDHNFFTSFSHNISEGGIFIAMHQLHSPGTLVDLAFTLPGGRRVECQGEVCWVRDCPSTNTLAPGVGVRFRDLPGEALADIRRFVAQRDPLFFEE